MASCIYAAGRITGGNLELEIILTRESTPSGSQSRTFAKLMAGSLHDDCLLLHESLVLEHFPSPYTVKFATRNPVPADVQAVTVAASVILDKLIGLDVTRVVTIPKTANLQCGGPKAQQASSAEQHDGIAQSPVQLRSQQQHGYSQTDTHHEFCPRPQASAAPSQQQVRKPVPSRPSGQSHPGVAPSVAPADQPMGLQQKLAGQLQHSQAAAPTSTARTGASQQANRLHSAAAPGSTVGTIARAGSKARGLGPGASETRTASGKDHGSTASESGAAIETSTAPSCPARTNPGTRAASGVETGGAATRGPPLHGQTSNAGILPAGPAKGGKQRRKLVHTVCLQPDAPPSSDVHGQIAAGLPCLQPAGVQSLGRTQIPPDQVKCTASIHACSDDNKDFDLLCFSLAVSLTVPKQAPAYGQMCAVTSEALMYSQLFFLVSSIVIRSAFLSHVKLLRHLVARSDCLKDSTLPVHAVSEPLSVPLVCRPKVCQPVASADTQQICFCMTGMLSKHLLPTLTTPTTMTYLTQYSISRRSQSAAALKQMARTA